MPEYHWKDLLPVDGYIVTLKGLLHGYDRKIVIGLYQPLIGSLAANLFFALWNEVDNTQPIGVEMTHHSLLTSMQVSLKEIHQARQKLEAIGLLKVYVKEEEETRCYIYELQAPLSPADFFEDPILNIFLYGSVGARRYSIIRNAFSYVELSLEGYKNVTRSFHDVFQPFSPGQLATFQNYKDILSNERKTIGRKKEETITLGTFSFDFDLFEKEIEHFLLPKRVITEGVKELIVKLAYLYGLNPLEVASVTVDSRESDESINEEKLRKYAREKYQFKHESQLPIMYERTQVEAVQQKEKKEPQTQEEKYIATMEQLSPIEFLIGKMGGAKPSASDMKIIENVMLNQKLPPGVVNVLLDYVLIIKDNKLPKGYVEKIASTWALEKVRTVKEAMALAKQEQKAYQERMKNKNKPRQATKTAAPIRKEIVPDWALNKEKVEQPKKTVTSTTDKEKERQELEAMLKQFKKD